MRWTTTGGWPLGPLPIAWRKVVVGVCGHRERLQHPPSGAVAQLPQELNHRLEQRIECSLRSPSRRATRLSVPKACATARTPFNRRDTMQRIRSCCRCSASHLNAHVAHNPMCPPAAKIVDADPLLPTLGASCSHGVGASSDELLTPVRSHRNGHFDPPSPPQRCDGSFTCALNLREAPLQEAAHRSHLKSKLLRGGMDFSRQKRIQPTQHLLDEGHLPPTPIPRRNVWGHIHREHPIR